MLTTIEQESSSVRLLHCIFEKDLRGPSINSAGTVSSLICRNRARLGQPPTAGTSKRKDGRDLNVATAVVSAEPPTPRTDNGRQAEVKGVEAVTGRGFI